MRRRRTGWHRSLFLLFFVTLGLWGWVDDLLNGATDVLKAVRDLIAAIFNPLISFLESTFSGIYQWLERLEQGLHDVYDGAVNWAISAIGKAVDVIRGWVNEAISLAHGAYDGAVNWAISAIGKAVDVIRGWVNDAISLAHSAYDGAVNKSIELVSGLIDTLLGPIRSVIQELTDNVLPTLRKAWDWIVWFAEHPFDWPILLLQSLMERLSKNVLGFILGAVEREGAVVEDWIARWLGGQ